MAVMSPVIVMPKPLSGTPLVVACPSQISTAPLRLSEQAVQKQINANPCVMDATVALVR